MPGASDNKFPKVILEERATDGSDTSNPAADHRALFLGEDGALHLRDSSGTVTDVSSGGSSHGSSIAYDLGADVPVASANTYTDAASGTPAAGTYDIFWKVLCAANSGAQTAFKCRLLAGATEIDYSEGVSPSNERASVYGFALGVVLDGSTVVKTQMRANQATTTISRDGGNGVNHDATKIELRKTH